MCFVSELNCLKPGILRENNSEDILKKNKEIEKKVANRVDGR